MKKILLCAIIIAAVFSFAGCRAAGVPASAGTGVRRSEKPRAEAERLSTNETETSAEPEQTPTPSPSVPLEDYNGQIYHLFFHPLVFNTAAAFDGDSQAAGMDSFMATSAEFRRVLEETYERDFVLCDLEMFYGFEEKEDGTTEFVRKTVQLPVGKKPLVISIDDINYYQYMRDEGCIWKLALNEEGELRDYYVDEDGLEHLTEGLDVVTITEQFVREHPDYSFNGYKLLLAPTGYDGILGYRTQWDSPNREEELAAVKPVVAKLKERGYGFASHSYMHHHMAEMSEGEVSQDLQQYLDEVQSLVGGSSVFIYPYGERIDFDLPQHRLLNDYGYHIFCGVGPRPYESIDGVSVMTDRMNVDGVSLRRDDDSYFAELWVNSEVIDLAGRSGERVVINE